MLFVQYLEIVCSALWIRSASSILVIPFSASAALKKGDIQKIILQLRLLFIVSLFYAGSPSSRENPQHLQEGGAH